MAKKVVWTRRAQRKLLSVTEYIEAEFGDLIAQRFVKRTFEVIDISRSIQKLEPLNTRKSLFEAFFYQNIIGYFIGQTKNKLLFLTFLTHDQDLSARKFKLLRLIKFDRLKAKGSKHFEPFYFQQVLKITS